MTERIYEKPVLLRLDDRYDCARGACNAGGVHNCAPGAGYGSQTNHTCGAGNFATPTCSTGSSTSCIYCSTGSNAFDPNCVNGPSGGSTTKCATGCAR